MESCCQTKETEENYKEEILCKGDNGTNDLKVVIENGRKYIDVGGVRVNKGFYFKGRKDQINFEYLIDNKKILYIDSYEEGGSLKFFSRIHFEEGYIMYLYTYELNEDVLSEIDLNGKAIYRKLLSVDEVIELLKKAINKCKLLEDNELSKSNKSLEKEHKFL